MADAFQSRILNLFPTAVLVGQMPDAGRMNTALRAVIAARRASHPGIRRSNVLGWHSSIDMLAWGGAAAHELGQKACAFVDPYTADLGSKDKPRFGWMAEMWANVSPRMASNQMHAHPGALWSLVYYVDDGYGAAPDTGAAGEGEGGELTLYDPRFPANRMYAPDMAFRWPDGRTDVSTVPIRPRTGMVVAFPSWMNHAVTPYLGMRERISIAINLMIAYPPAGGPAGPESGPG